MNCICYSPGNPLRECGNKFCATRVSMLRLQMQQKAAQQAKELLAKALKEEEQTNG